MASISGFSARRVHLFAVLLVASVTSVACGQNNATHDDAIFADRSTSPPAASPAPAPEPPNEPMSIAKTEPAPAPQEVLWKGFLVGEPAFRNFPRPVGSPLYFEDPFINTDLRLVYVYHDFPKGSALHGGGLNVWAAQARLAITDRLQFTATCDGYSALDARALAEAEGWNDLALGLKYAFWVDTTEKFIASAGLKWRLSNGHSEILMGGVDELTPYLSAAKSWGKLNGIAHVAGRLPMDEHMGNYILSWDLHLDYEVVENFFPLIEFHGVHYLSDGDRLPLDVGGLDYANIGSNDVAGESAYWAGIGFRWNIVDHVSWGAAWEFPLQNPNNNDIFDQRVTTNIIITY